MKATRVAILTRTSTLNFGTILQNYALQNYLKEKAVAVQTIHDAIPRQLYSREKKGPFPRTFKATVLDFLDRVCSNFSNREVARIEKKILRFTKKNIRYYYVDTFEKMNEDFDVFIAGSDQIWAHAAEPDLYRYFMLAETAEEKKRLAYAVSIGELGTCKEWISNAKHLLPRFDALSVREETSKRNISSYTTKQIAVVCDPVFLFKRDFWEKLAHKGRHPKGEYVFVYFLSDNEWYYKHVESTAATLDCQIRLFRREIKSEKGNRYKKAKIESPEDFLSAILNAKFVITDSYHCLIFSILFQRDFEVLQRYSENSCTQNSRLIELLDRIEANEQYCNRETPVSKDRLHVHYSFEKLEEWIAFSKKFLDNNLI